jgi:uncharacterized protein YxeA
MKKIRFIIIALILIIGIAASSCSKKLCPAYAKADIAQTSARS